MLLTDINARRMFLENKLAALQKRLEELRIKEKTELAEEDLEESATRASDTELEEAMLTEEMKLVRDIKNALKRIDEGTYGYCRVCGQPIPARRLEALPWAELCVKDQQESEKFQHHKVTL
ncbi:TraR/DksA family transcriptional regulator [Dictyobacter kobayashii]|uniref:Zinc finger DksA/TraR C4-type domain-containing protein n=1 Tax=Dictyobacter kobayashii TaxID=2014872 RepID=A0A402AN41_9CHLR|nr:TraR/DksA family transcriptional regulator [Dictyobacter kobayashii]GCE20536.1 hypothetical protein KDK_43360 [Dictyobacter kobayashii]